MFETITVHTELPSENEISETTAENLFSLSSYLCSSQHLPTGFNKRLFLIQSFIPNSFFSTIRIVIFEEFKGVVKASSLVGNPLVIKIVKKLKLLSAMALIYIA